MLGKLRGVGWGTYRNSQKLPQPQRHPEKEQWATNSRDGLDTPGISDPQQTNINSDPEDKEAPNVKYENEVSTFSAYIDASANGR